MRGEVYYKLVDIRNRYGEQVLGQICQDLLAMSFVEIGCRPEGISVHNIEGVDIIIDDDNFGRYAVEVKTTSGTKVTLGEKDHDGLKKYSNNNYRPLLAILKIELLRDWIFVDGNRLNGSGILYVDRLYTDARYKGIAEKINRAFENLLIRQYHEILNRGQSYLKEKLRDEGIRYSGG